METGKRKGAPLAILQHGFPDTPATWGPLKGMLQGMGYEVLTPWLPGLEPAEEGWTGEACGTSLAQSLADRLRALDARQALLVGHDWGVTGVCGAAILEPDRVKAVVAISVPHGGLLAKAWMSDALQQRLSWYMYFFQLAFAPQAVAADDCAFLKRLWQDWSPGWQAPSELLDAVAACYGRPEALRHALDYYRNVFNPSAALRTPKAQELRSRLFGPVPVPALYVHGAQDGCILEHATHGMEPLFPAGLKRVVVPHAGHFPHLEQAGLVNAQVAAFLDGLR